MDSAPLDDVVD